jgi:hypothetical protein
MEDWSHPHCLLWTRHSNRLWPWGTHWCAKLGRLLRLYTQSSRTTDRGAHDLLVPSQRGIGRSVWQIPRHERGISEVLASKMPQRCFHPGPASEDRMQMGKLSCNEVQALPWESPSGPNEWLSRASSVQRVRQWLVLWTLMIVTRLWVVSDST